MRVSGIKSHPSYRLDWSTFAVKVDGEVVRDCLFADDQEGRVIHCLVDQVDNVLVVNSTGTGPKLAERRGKVTIYKTSLPLTDRYSDAFLALFSADSPSIVRPH